MDEANDILTLPSGLLGKETVKVAEVFNDAGDFFNFAYPVYQVKSSGVFADDSIKNVC